MCGKTRALLYVGGLDWTPLTAHLLDAHRLHKSMDLHQLIYKTLRGLHVLVERPVGRLLRREGSGTCSTQAAYITESIPRLAEVEIQRIYTAITEPIDGPHSAVLPDGPLVFTFRVCMGRIRSACDVHVGSCHDRPIFFETVQKLYPHFLANWVIQLGCALANLHWGASVDGDGVNVILGNARQICGELPVCRLWLTDLDRCEPLQFSPDINLKQMATAVVCNPCWPLPPGLPCFRDATLHQRRGLTGAWKSFSSAYLSQSLKLMDVRVSGYECREKQYPKRFIDHMEGLVVNPPASLSVPHYLAPFDPQYQPIIRQVSNSSYLTPEEDVTRASPVASFSAGLVDEDSADSTVSSSSESGMVLEEEVEEDD